MSFLKHNKLICQAKQCSFQPLKVKFGGICTDFLVSGDSSIDGGVDHPVEAHAEQIDVSVKLLVLVLTDQGAQLLVLVLHHIYGVLQRTNLNLQYMW